MDEVLQPGKAITYSFGTRWGPHRLTRSFIFDDSSAKEGVKVWIKDQGRIKRSY